MAAAKETWSETKALVQKGKIVKNVKIRKDGKRIRETYFPNQSFNGVVHVRPHGKDSNDNNPLPVKDLYTGEGEYTKHSFWINACYLKESLIDRTY